MNSAAINSRTVALEGTQNFRDLGGLRSTLGMTKSGVVYRSERLSTLTSADAAHLGGFGIRTIIDMRSTDERQRAPNRLPQAFAGQELLRPFLPRHTATLIEKLKSGEYDTQQAYEHMLTQYVALALDHVAEYQTIIGDLLSPGATPAILHCTSGKDRTGIISAILLLAVGVSMEAVVEDYIMSHAQIGKVDFFEGATNEDAVGMVMSAKREYIEAAIRAMHERFGSIEAYLHTGIGISAQQLQQLRQLLLDS